MNKVYNYRYIQGDTKVFYIGKPLSKRSHDTMIYSEPFYSKERNEYRNAIIAYNNDIVVRQKMDTLMCKEEAEVLMLESDVDHMKYLSQLFRMPLVVEMNSYCDFRDGDGVEQVDVWYFVDSNNLILFKKIST